MQTNSLLLSFVLSLALTACGKDEQDGSGAPADTAAPSESGQVVSDNLAAGANAGTATDAYGFYAVYCISCHGGLGEGVAGNPKLAVLSRADIASRLRDYRDGKQMGPRTAVMAAMAKNLTDAEINALANYVGG